MKLTTEQIQLKINSKTKPLGALGQLEQLALQICQVQNSLTPQFVNPIIFVVAADHGIAKEGVSAYPQEVTWQMVYNFLQGGAAINVFARQHHIQVKVVDAGVNKDFESHLDLIQGKVNYGTKNFAETTAMTQQELEECFDLGKSLVFDAVNSKRSNVIGFGEMGIGNTTSASAIMHAITQIPLEECVGKGTGINEEGYAKKMKFIEQAFQRYGHCNYDVHLILQTYGGFEIATIVSSMLEAANQKILFLVDGFIATVAYLAAYTINPTVKIFAIFCHQSQEKGHQRLLQYLNAQAILKLDMRLGEGTGCALAYPLLVSAVNMMNEMASFESASVSNQI